MSSTRSQIAVFFLIATAIYGSLHLYLWWKITRQLELRGPAAIALVIFFAAMVVAPFLGRLLRSGTPALEAIEFITFLWMGVAFYLFVLNLTADMWNLAATTAYAVTGGHPIPVLGGHRLFIGIAVATALIVGWAAVEAGNVRLRHVTIHTAKLSPGTRPLRIAQVSDIHLGLLLGRRRLTTILDRVREAQPDLLVATGDLLDAVGDHLEPLAGMWRAVQPRLGKFAVTGNHEYYTGIPGATSFLEASGFRVLRDETVTLPGELNIIGQDFQAPPGLPGAPARRRPLASLAREADAALFTLALKHLPTGFDEEAAPLGVDLQLSGHTHDGQMYPFRWLVRLSFRHLAGLYRNGESFLYVSRGTGTWGPPLRFLAPPEVTLIEIVPSSR